MNERAFIAQLEGANTQELIQILSRPSPEQERVLRLHLGAGLYERLRQLALRTAKRGAKKGNVIVLHGIMGGELTVYEGNGNQRIWLHFLRIIKGGAGWLRMGEKGASIFDVRPTGILKKWYSELLLGLEHEWNVQAFWFDWRRDIYESAEALHKKMNEWFGEDAPVHLIGHSMGGLVSRTFILKYPERWKRAWDSRRNGIAGGRLIMLGTPNHGSFAIPQIATGVEASVRKLAIADLEHSAAELVAIVNTFPGSYQMLPSPARMKEMKPLYDAKTYGQFQVAQAYLDNALRFHEALEPVVDRDRMVYVAGYNRRTYDGIRNFAALQSLEAYSVSLNGDGTVPHRLGFLEQDGKRIPTYFADAAHGALPNHESVIGAAPELLETGQCSLPDSVPARARGVMTAAAETSERARSKMEETRLAEIVAKTQARARGPQAEEAPVSHEEREAEQMIVRGFLGDVADPDRVAGASLARDGRTDLPAQKPPGSGATAKIEIRLVKGGIQNATGTSKDGLKIDAIAVGHYFGVKPQAAERALDEAISAAYLARKPQARKGQPGKLRDSELLITLLTERGHLHGNLGEPFILPDPRDPNRLIVLAGMGTPGHFGVPELTVLAQELCWSLGRLQKRHLATVLIGAGEGNLSVDDAVSGWLRGIRRALVSSADDEGRQLQCVTFVERDPRVLRVLDYALQSATEKGNPDLVITYRGPSKQVLVQARREARVQARQKADAEFDRAGSPKYDERVPVRITVGLEGKTYQFAALTQSASIPQRDIPLDPRLVNEANDELAAAGLDDQNQSGRFLEKLLIPEDIRALIYTPAPIVLMVDSTTARVHWEMIARTEALGPGAAPDVFNPDNFLGTSFGLTRQLRTTFAPTPEPPPPPKRIIKVLVVADPADDAPLAGAQAEGEEVATTFESFNSVFSAITPYEIQVTRLFGPAQAKRTTVLKKLMLENFDVLHFAGHCLYDKIDPSNSGWLFSLKDDERITANELKRIDRVPKFIFSNACESGITPDRSGDAGMAPAFAESFFARGVANFICTAWPVDDEAARTFARRLYSELLGLSPATDFAFLHTAMREARRAIASDFAGARTWGAYQHYGNPYFRFFNSGDARSEKGTNRSRKQTKPTAKRAPAKRRQKHGTRARSRARKH
jgi:pimeloyl-ACP methyl ester carboxylesterase